MANSPITDRQVTIGQKILRRHSFDESLFCHLRRRQYIFHRRLLNHNHIIIVNGHAWVDLSVKRLLGVADLRRPPILHCEQIRRLHGLAFFIGSLKEFDKGFWGLTLHWRFSHDI